MRKTKKPVSKGTEEAERAKVSKKEDVFKMQLLVFLSYTPLHRGIFKTTADI